MSDATDTTLIEVDYDNEQLVKMDYVLALLAASRTTLYRMINAGQFPSPLKFAGGTVNRWRLADIKTAMAKLRAERAVAPEVKAVPVRQVSVVRPIATPLRVGRKPKPKHGRRRSG